MRCADITHVGLIPRPPFPRWPKDVYAQRFHCAWRNVDQQSVIMLAIIQLVTVGNGLEMRAKEINVPTVHIFLRGLDDVPRLLNKLNERQLALSLLDIVKISLEVDLPRKLNHPHRTAPSYSTMPARAPRALQHQAHSRPKGL